MSRTSLSPKRRSLLATAAGAVGLIPAKLPELFSEEIRAAFRSLRSSRNGKSL
jgi:hypothetical protein